MSNLESIFDNIDEYANHIDDLVRALKAAGVKNFSEFRAAAKEFGVPVKKTIQDQVLAKFESSEEDDWSEAKRINTEDSYQQYLDSYPDGQYRQDARDCIDTLRDNKKISDSEDLWNCVDKEDISQLQDFVEKYPKSRHYSEASRLLKELRKEQYLGVDINALTRQIETIKTDPKIPDPENAIYEKIVSYIDSKKISIDDLLGAIANDNNFISGKVAYKLWENEIITDFTRASIDSAFITHMMSNIPPQRFQKPQPISQITKTPCTEVYFWGIPSSGKSCALGAILSAANSGRIARSMQKDNGCQGYGYMNRLAELFKTDGSVGTLPEGTPIASTYEMGFILEDEKGKEHPITCVDLAGELVRCMYKKDANEPLTGEEQSVLDTLTNLLVDHRTENRKMHFFVIEYGAENRLYEGLPQKTYLEAAVEYIRRTGIFKKDTDGLYLLITKVDKAKAVKQELKDKLKAYISDNYLGFFNGLKAICRNNEINGGVVEIIPFTLGTVCFQNYCKFKDETANKVVQTLIDRSYGYKPGKLKRIFDSLKK